MHMCCADIQIRMDVRNVCTYTHLYIHTHKDVYIYIYIRIHKVVVHVFILKKGLHKLHKDG